MPSSLQMEVAKLQHAGAAVLSSFVRLEEMGSRSGALGIEDELQIVQSIRSPTLGTVIDGIDSLSLDAVEQPHSPNQLASTHNRTHSSISSMALSSRRYSDLVDQHSTSTPESTYSRRSSNSSFSTTSLASPSMIVDPWTLKCISGHTTPSAVSSRCPSFTSLATPSLLSPLLSHTPSPRRTSQYEADYFNTPCIRTISGSKEPELPSSPAVRYYRAELAFLRSDALVRLRHAARRIDVECMELRRIEVESNDDDLENGQSSDSSNRHGTSGHSIGAIKAWWEAKKEIVQLLEGRCVRMMEALVDETST